MYCGVILAGVHLECHSAVGAVQHWGHLPPWSPVHICYHNIESNMKHISVNSVVFSKLALCVI